MQHTHPVLVAFTEIMTKIAEEKAQERAENGEKKDLPFTVFYCMFTVLSPEGTGPFSLLFWQLQKRSPSY